MYIYIHVPFCRSHCIYCDFYVSLAKHGGQAAYVDALLREIDGRMRRFVDAGGELTPIETVYFGGGTPSLLPAADYQRILAALTAWGQMVDGAEVTMEANPGGRHEAMASPPQDYLAVGMNRFSIGVQSLSDTELKRLSRAHTAEDAIAFVNTVSSAGFENLSVDLMYGLPGQTTASWQETLSRVRDLPVPHVSMYGLKVEEGTPLATLGRFPAYTPPPDDTVVAMYDAGVASLEAAGMRLYEFSNLARPGFESRHNLNYWRNGAFFGFGPSATGYLQGVRYWVTPDLAAYSADPMAVAEETRCSRQEQLENAFIFGLRLTDGLCLEALAATHGPDALAPFEPVVARHLAQGWLHRQGSRIRLSRAAIPLSNAILADYLLDE
ncbi:MAG: radical SAM family heme chaperone HemW [Candidatus Melainabacteria bacterium]